MSCPSSNSPLRLFKEDEYDVEMPQEYYIYTLLMIALVIGIPYIYRQIWIVLFDVTRYYRRPKHLRGTPPGCRKLGKPGHRNLSNEFPTRELSHGQVTEKAPGARVEALFVYPIKSCYSIELESNEVAKSGFEHDRQFCFAQWHEPAPVVKTNSQREPEKGSSAYWNRIPHWHFMTQRQNPSLTHLKTELWVPDPDSPEYAEESELIRSGGCMVVSFAFSPSPTSVGNIIGLIAAKIKARSSSAIPVWTFQIPLKPTAEQIETNGYDTEKVALWADEPNGINMTSEIPTHILNQLKALLNEDTKTLSPTRFARLKKQPELRLYRIDRAKDRDIFKCAPTKDQLGYQSTVAFQDSYPVSIQNIASITDAESHIPHDKAFKPDSRRYRANIYVSGRPAYDEDDWTLIRIGQHEFHVSCRTTRCKLPTNNPDTGVLGSDTQPYNYLMKNRDIDEGAPKSGCLGMMMVPAMDTLGAVIKIGDEVDVVQRGKHFKIG